MTPDLLVPGFLKQSAGKRILASVRNLQETDRHTCFDAYHRTSAGLANAYEQAGIRATVRALPCRPFDGSGAWVLPETFKTRTVAVTVESPRGFRLADASRNPCHVVMGSASTGPAGIPADLEVFDRPDDLRHLPAGALSGRAVLMAVAPREVAADLARTGACAILSAVPVRNSPDAVRWQKLGFGGMAYGASALRPVAVSVSDAQAARLRRLAANGKRVRLHLTVDIQAAAPEHPLTDAWIEGEDPSAGEAWCVGHIMEPGALDNASGAAVCVEMARLLWLAIHHGGMPRPRRTIRFIHGFECFGPFQYFMGRGPVAVPPLAGVVLDAVGAVPEVCLGHLGWYGSVPGSAPVVDRIGAACLREAMRRSNPGYLLRQHPFSPSSENLLGDPAYGFPCPWLTTCYQPDGRLYDAYHSSADLPRLLSPQGLSTTAAAMAAMTAILAGLDAPALMRLATYERMLLLRRHDRAEPAAVRHQADRLQATLRWVEQHGAGAGSAAVSKLNAWRAETDRLLDGSRCPDRPGRAALFRRLRPLTPHDANLHHELRLALQQTGLPVHALYWVDGRRSAADIAERLSGSLARMVTVQEVLVFLDVLQKTGFVEAC